MTDINGIVAGGDLTGDGVPDLMLRHSDTKQTDVLPGTGTGSFSHALGPFRALRGLGSVTAGNLIGTSTLEAIGINYAGKLAIRSVNGFSNVGSTIDAGRTIPSADQVIDLGDWNGDGHADIATRPAGSDNLWLRKRRRQG